jgi:Skp family chaperone for outer membrane proteins
MIMRRLALIGLVLALMSLAAMAGAAPASPLFAAVDTNKIEANYQAFKQGQEDFRTYNTEVERKLDLNRRLRLLEDKEAQELKDLRALTILKPEQSARMKELEGLSDSREQELMVLQDKGTNLTPAESARQQALMAIAAKRAPEVAAEEKRLTETRKSRYEALSNQFSQALQDAVEKVAKDKGVSLVFNKDMVIWAALDLSDAVIAELNQPPKTK